MGNKKSATITEGFTKVYIQNEYKTGGSVVRLISWLVDGKPTPVRLERRDYFLDQEGNRRNAKCKGFTSADLGWIYQHYNEIEADMIKATNDFERAKADAETEKEEVPFA